MKVWGASGVRSEGLGSGFRRVWGIVGVRISGLGCRLQGLRVRFQGLAAEDLPVSVSYGFFTKVLFQHELLSGCGVILKHDRVVNTMVLLWSTNCSISDLLYEGPLIYLLIYLLKLPHDFAMRLTAIFNLLSF